MTLRELRLSKKLTLSKVSDLTGITMSTLSRLENGIRKLENIPLRHAVALKKAYGLNNTKELLELKWL